MRRTTRTYAAAIVAVVAACGLPGTALSGAKKGPVDDSKLNCKQLNGRIQIMILQARTYSSQNQASGTSRTLQWGLAKTFGNNDVGIDPEGTHAAELKTLRDYNQRLVDLGCKSFDVDAELRVQDPHETPAARVPAVKKPKAASPPAAGN